MIPDESLAVKEWLDGLTTWERGSSDPSAMLSKFADDLDKTTSRIRTLAMVWKHIVNARYKLNGLKEQYEAVSRELKQFDIIKGGEDE